MLEFRALTHLRLLKEVVLVLLNEVTLLLRRGFLAFSLWRLTTCRLLSRFFTSSLLLCCCYHYAFLLLLMFVKRSIWTFVLDLILKISIPGVRFHRRASLQHHRGRPARRVCPVSFVLLSAGPGRFTLSLHDSFWLFSNPETFLIMSVIASRWRPMYMIVSLTSLEKRCLFVDMGMKHVND